MTKTVIGIFQNTNEAQQAVDQLMENGFTNANVDIATDNSMLKVGKTVADNNNGSETGLSKFFKNLFGNDDESTRYTKAAQNGSVVTVHASTPEEAQRAAELLDQYGAADIDGSFNQYGDAGSATNAIANDTNENEGQIISIMEENLQVGKREVETGGVRLRSRIIEKPVEESLRLREEHVRVERKKVDRAVTSADLDNFQEGTVELTEHAEVPVVAKEARIVEEISLGKTVEHRDETIQETVRNTEVDVEEINTNNTTKRNGRKN